MTRRTDRRYQTNPNMRAVPAPLPALRKRMHVRVVIPTALTVYARIRARAGAGGACRGVVNDVSAAGMALAIIEGSRYELPHEGQEVVVELNFEGTEAEVVGRVVRVGARELSIAYPAEPKDETVPSDLLTLVARVVTSRIDFVDSRRHVESLRARLAHRHFSSAGYLDVRVQVAPPAWWQAVFLEYLASWSEAGGLETGVIDRSYATEHADDALLVQPSVTRHARPWPALLRLAHLIATRCQAAAPTHADAFVLMQRTLAAAL
jgi:hypothetical protein